MTTAHGQVRLGTLQWPALAVGVLGLAAWGIAAATGAEHFFRAYLYGYLFWLGIALGGMALAMVHHLTGGRWGLPARQIGQTAALTLPLLIVLFIPLLFGLKALYPWARPEEVAHEELLRHRALYLNTTFFVVRAAVYFVIWTGMAVLLGLWSRRAEAGDVDARFRARALSAAGLVVYELTMTHAGVDWVVSRDVHFYTTAIGFVMTTGQTLVAMAFIILIVAWLIRAQREDLLPRTMSRPDLLNDLGNLLLVLVILWSYVTFFQFLVIWMGNTKEDNAWYVQRGIGSLLSWRWVGLFLVLAHFFIPFFLLLFRGSKRHLGGLTALAGLVFVAHLVEQYWLVAPSDAGPAGGPLDLRWVDFVTPLGIGGLWVALFLFLLGKRVVDVPAPLTEGSVHG